MPHGESLEQWRHGHDFLPSVAARGERRTRIVIGLTAVTMLVEIAAGYWYNSLALLADGWHMASHAAALGIALFAYAFARRHRDDPSFTFGTGKVGVLGGYSSAIVLAVVAVLMVATSVERLFFPLVIDFDQALLVAGVGLTVNLVSAWLLGGGPGHHHGAHPHGAHEHGAHEHAGHEHAGHEHGAHEHAGHEHAGHGHAVERHGVAAPHPARAGTDHNLRAAYLHVLADALTSVLAIGALLAGKYLGYAWLDPAMGLLGAFLILRWARGLLLDTSHVLLDHGVDRRQAEAVRRLIEADGSSQVADLHLFYLSPEHVGAIVSVVSCLPRTADEYRSRLATLPVLAHVTVEVQRCAEHWPR